MENGEITLSEPCGKINGPVGLVILSYGVFKLVVDKVSRRCILEYNMAKQRITKPLQVLGDELQKAVDSYSKKIAGTSSELYSVTHETAIDGIRKPKVAKSDWD